MDSITDTADLALLANNPLPKQRVLVSGASGLVGRFLLPLLKRAGHEVVVLSRSDAPSAIVWNPVEGLMPAVSALEGFDAVVHLAGENIAEKRWTEVRKLAIRQSRVLTTTLLAESLAKCRQKPKTLVCASATGIYGERGDNIVDENSTPGEGFLADLGQAWENAAEPARLAGIRVAHLRFGVLLTPQGGALAKMLPAFRLGLGATLGSGKQFMSWASIDDAVRSILFVLARNDLEGPINITSPHAERNSEFTRTLAKVLSRPAFFTVPEFALRAIFGELADQLLLTSTRAYPLKLLRAGFQFSQQHLEDAFRHVIARRIISKAE